MKFGEVLIGVIVGQYFKYLWLKFVGALEKEPIGGAVTSRRVLDEFPGEKVAIAGK